MERLDWAFRTVLKVSKADMARDDGKNPVNHSVVEEMDEQYGPLPLSSTKPSRKVREALTIRASLSCTTTVDRSV